jgi:hypothetical protein
VFSAFSGNRARWFFAKLFSMWGRVPAPRREQDLSIMPDTENEDPASQPTADFSGKAGGSVGSARQIEQGDCARIASDRRYDKGVFEQNLPEAWNY